MSPGRVTAGSHLLVVCLAVACLQSVSSGQQAIGREEAAPQRPVNVETATFPVEWTFKPGARPPFAEHGMVASNNSQATLAAVEILKKGGNAIDAAVALGFALAVAYPEAGNIGGGGYAVVKMADGRTAALDYRERAPGSASRDMFIGEGGKPTEASLVGHKASGVPGSVAGMLALLEKFGTLPRAEVLAPSLRLAREGVEVDEILRTSIEQSAPLIRRFAGAALLLPDGRLPPLGARIVQPDLARTLERIVASGLDGFYKGPVADALASEMVRGGGLITLADLAAYRPAWRAPISGSYRGYGLLTMPPSSSGGVTVVEALNILESWEAPAKWGTPLAWHRLASAFQRAFVDRNELLGDPDVVSVPVERLTNKAYARSIGKRVDDDKASPTASLTPLPREGSETTNYAVVDRWGNAVAITTTINSLYGSGVWVPGGGFFLNNQMDDFAVQPGTPNQFGLVQGEANAVAPGKRMLSAMAPTVVTDPKGQVVLLVGGRGGPRIITAVAQVIVNVIDHRMTLADAAGAPRIHHQALPDTLEYEKGGVPEATVKALRSRGWAVKAGPTGSVTAIMRARGGWEGLFDPRKHGLAAGY